MRKKSIEELVSSVNPNPRYDLRMNDYIELTQIDDRANIISRAFLYGYLQGSKAAKKKGACA